MSKLRVVSLSTDDNELVRNFEKTAQHFGYEYYFVGRGKKFRGWPWRTMLYISAIRRLSKDPTTDIFVLCDSNDLIFVAPSDEMRDKFVQSGKKILIGAEPACCNGHYGNRKFRPHALNICAQRETSRYRFPNGGFMIGYAKELLVLLERNKREEDDQGGYLQKYIDYDPSFELDTKSSIVGNYPTINEWYYAIPEDDFYRAEITYWKFDTTSGRWKSLVSGESPCAMHFPGRSFIPFNIISETLFPIERPKTKTLETGNPTVSANIIALPYVPSKVSLLRGLNGESSSSNNNANNTTLAVALILLVLLVAIVVVFIVIVLSFQKKNNKPKV